MYDANSELQRCILEAVAPLINYAAVRVPIPAQRTFSIVDYGCSEGRNSVGSVKKIIHSVHERDPGKWISVLHNDLPMNDFNSLFENLYAAPESSYLSTGNEEQIRAGSKIFAFASGASFYGRVAPDDSVDFALSSCATHWLSAMPDYSICNHIFHGNATADEARRLGRVGANDWKKFLHARADEMTSGARMVLTMAGRLHQANSADLYPSQNLMDLMNQTLLDLVAEGRIVKEIYERFALPIYCRSVEETVAPLQDTHSDLINKFTVEYAETHRIKCDHFERLRMSDATWYAHEIVESLRAFTQPVIEQGLFCNSFRNDEHLTAKDRGTVASLYSRMKQRVAADPEQYDLEPVSVFLVLSRI